MAPSFQEPRLPPLQATFLECKELFFSCRDAAEVEAMSRTWAIQRFRPSRLRRRHSIGGYVPHGLAELKPRELPVSARRRWAATDAFTDMSAVSSQTRDAASVVWPDTEDELELPESSPFNPCIPASCRTIQTGPSPIDQVTTLMLRNLPPCLSQQALMQELDRSGFAGLYDFLYMPSSFEAREGKGYAFVNMISSVAAATLVGAWHGSRRFGTLPEGSPGGASAAPLNISPALVQGLEANLRKWARMSRVRDPSFRPFTRAPGPACGLSPKATSATLECSPLSCGGRSEAAFVASLGRFGGAAAGSESPAGVPATLSLSTSLSSSRDVAASSVASLEPTELEDGITTLMVRNLPRDLIQQSLLEELDRVGFAGVYDFVYMPCSFEARETKGYAFINFTTHTAALAFASSWQRSRRFSPDGVLPPLNISAAAVQGLEANTQKWAGPRMTRIRNPALRPYVRNHHSGGRPAAPPALASPSPRLTSHGADAGGGPSPAAAVPLAARPVAPRQPWRRTVAAGLPVVSTAMGGPRTLAAAPSPAAQHGLRLESRSCAGCAEGDFFDM